MAELKPKPFDEFKVGYTDEEEEEDRSNLD